MRVLVTGSTGFIGGHLVTHLRARGVEVICAALRLAPDTDWLQALAGVDAVIHCAAKTDSSDDEETVFRVNVESTVRLAQQALVSGVKRFIFLSSIKVNGEETQPGRPFTAADTPNPSDAYGRSKQQAEHALLALVLPSMDVVILRPPMVYGRGMKGNIRLLSKLIMWRLPLPFASVHNARSMIAVGNLIDAITTCLTAPAAANQIFLVSDDHDLSTPDLIRGIARSMGTRVVLIPFPQSLLYALARLLNRRAMAQRLCGNLQLDITPIKQRLNWHPPIAVDAAFRICF